MDYLVKVGEILTVLSNILPNEDVAVFKEDAKELFYAVQALLPHIRLKEKQRHGFSKQQLSYCHITVTMELLTQHVNRNICNQSVV